MEQDSEQECDPLLLCVESKISGYGEKDSHDTECQPGFDTER